MNMIVIHKIYFCFFDAAASLAALLNYLSFRHILDIILRTKIHNKFEASVDNCIPCCEFEADDTLTVVFKIDFPDCN